MTREQAQHWGEACGAEGTLYPKVSTAQVMLRGWSTERADGVSIDCMLEWGENKGRPQRLIVRVVAPQGYAVTLGDFAPYLHLLENELPASLRPYIRRFASDGSGYVRKSSLAIEVLNFPHGSASVRSLRITDDKAFESP